MYDSEEQLYVVSIHPNSIGLAEVLLMVRFWSNNMHSYQTFGVLIIHNMHGYEKFVILALAENIILASFI